MDAKRARLVKRQLRKAPAETGRLLDFAPGGWGRDAAVRPLEDGLRVTGHCWWPVRPCPGDQILLRAGQGLAARYRLVTVEACGDPDDMYRIEAVFDPRGVPV